MPVSRIETLSQGYFLGKVADNNTTKIARKLFCGEIQIDMERYRQKQKIKKPLPVMTDFDEFDIGNNVRRLGEEVIRQDLESSIMESEHRQKRFPSSADIAPQVDKVFRSMSHDEKEAILRKVTERKVKEHVDSMVKRNYERIKQEVWDIIVTENAKLPKPHELGKTA